MEIDGVGVGFGGETEIGLKPYFRAQLPVSGHPGYYGAFVLDPDDNNVEAVFHGVTA